VSATSPGPVCCWPHFPRNHASQRAQMAHNTYRVDDPLRESELRRDLSAKQYSTRTLIAVDNSVLHKHQSARWEQSAFRVRYADWGIEGGKGVSP
jgi:hypothetical protein